MFLHCDAGPWKGEVEGARRGTSNDTWSDSERDWWVQGRAEALAGGQEWVKALRNADLRGGHCGGRSYWTLLGRILWPNENTATLEF